MRILAAMVISITGAATAFLAVLAALDDPRPAVASTPVLSDRLLAFAAPDLAGSQAHLALVNQPPSTVGRYAAPPMLAESRLELPETAKPVRAAFVPPLPRRKPIDPALPADVAAAPPKSATSAVAEAKPVRAKAPVPPSVASGAPIDTSTRSALGGPRPGTSKSPKPATAQ